MVFINKFLAFLIRVGLRIAALGGFTQVVTWLFGVDEQTHGWLATHRDLVVIGLISYVCFDYAMYGAVQIERNEIIKSAKKERKKK